MLKIHGQIHLRFVAKKRYHIKILTYNFSLLMSVFESDINLKH